MSTIVREYGPCEGCGGSGRVRDASVSNPLMVILSLGTNLEKRQLCPICGGSGRVVTKETEIELFTD